MSLPRAWFAVAVAGLLLACGEFKQPPSSSPDRATGGADGNPGGAGGAANPGQGARGGPDASISQPGGPGDPSGAGNGGAPACSVGQTRCATSGPAAVETCTVGGAWMMQKTCTSICANGECAGACTPDDKQCGAGQKPAVCSKDGVWVPGEPCPNVCTGKGECTGECKPGSTQCGDGPNALVPYECDDKGKWIAQPTCMNLCSKGSCGGSCPPGKLRCVADVPQTCGPMGTWDPGQPCKNQACVDGMCVGSCEPKAVKCGSSNNIQTCDAKGAWQDGDVCSGKTCVMGACAGACEPNAPKRCSPDQKAVQVCGAGGVWMNTDSCADRGCNAAACNMCKPGSKRCSGNTLQTCNGAGSAWGQDKPCDGSAHCNGNDVVSETCDAGAGKCAVNVRDTCKNGETCQTSKCGCPTNTWPCNNGCISLDAKCGNVCMRDAACGGSMKCQNSRCITPCAQSCDTSLHCNGDHTAVVAETCDTSNGMCKEQTKTPCTGGRLCLGSTCEFICSCSNTPHCNPDHQSYVMNNMCDKTTGNCKPGATVFCTDMKTCVEGQGCQ